MILFDSHAHLDDPRFDDDLDAVMARARAAGVQYVLTVGADAGRWERTLEVARSQPGVRAALAMHPHDAKDFHEAHEARLRERARAPEVVALGEIGLDFHYDNSPRDAQRATFRRQLELARELNLPVIVHLRDAMADALAILRDVARPTLHGVVHCFSGDEREAQELLDLGLYLGLGGMLTFPRADAVRRTAATLPLDRVLVETDCPYLAPVPNRGRRNEPAFVSYTLATLASLHGIAPDKAAQITTANARTLFGM